MLFSAIKSFVYIYLGNTLSFSSAHSHSDIVNCSSILIKDFFKCSVSFWGSQTTEDVIECTLLHMSTGKQ